MTKPANLGDKAAMFGALPWMTVFSGAASDSLTRAGEACNKACLDWQQEMARFATARWESDGQFGQKLLSCQNWADVAKVQQEWAAALARDYFNEATRLFGFILKLGTDSALRATADGQSAPELHQAAE